MKNRTFAMLSSLTLLTSAGAFAQSSTVLKADIPFEFRVGNKTLPPGHYDVHPQLVQGVTSLRCAECDAGVMIQTQAATSRNTPETGKLVFDRRGETYFLSAVWTPGDPQGRELPKTKAQRDFERELARSGSAITPVSVELARK